ncbi:4-hydroxy-tetrahydrodipicolinate reductase [Amylibacter sp.]|nr:4-hydroxy-tetrahydrodipicolinate reductase [Amylibacter sp.]
MKNLPKIVIVGASGRMGQMLVQSVLASNKVKLVGVTEREGHDWLGLDLGVCMGGAEIGINVSDNPLEVFKNAHAVIDFTSPKATIEHAKLAVKAGIVHVIGTTGMDAGHLDELKKLSKDIVIIRAGNMSLGLNLLTLLTKKISAVLDEDFDIEIVESHHKHKVDAPSGTALMLGKAAAEGRGVDLSSIEDRGRDGITGVRKRGDIGFHAIRGGDVVGEHDVIFAADGERIVLRHLATDRQIFVRGALRAAIWGQGKDAGEYDMVDVLGL